MGIYIREMAMPKTCKECDFAHLSIGKVYVCDRCDDALITGVETFPIIAARPIFCPLVEIKEPHGDLIDRDSLMRTLAENKDYFEHENVNCCCYFRNSANEPSTELWCVDEWVDGQPTIIERSEDDKI